MNPMAWPGQLWASVSSGDLLTRNRIINTWIVLHGFLFALIWTAYHKGYITHVLEADSTFITALIFAMIGVAVVISGFVSWKVNSNVNQIDQRIKEHRDKRMEAASTKGGATDADLRDTLTLRLLGHLDVFSILTYLLVTAGLLGTMVGLSISFSDIPEDIVTNQQAASQVIAQALSGLSTAIYTTLVGALGAAWVKLNAYVLGRSTKEMYIRIVEG